MVAVAVVAAERELERRLESGRHHKDVEAVAAN
jgi:hypothetical protein